MDDIKVPTLNPGKWQERIDGSRYREFEFGKAGEDGYYRDTLADEWVSNTNTEQTEEMYARYRNWFTITHFPTPEPTPADLDQQLRDAKRAALDAQVRVLDIEDQIHIANQPVTDDETVADEVISE